MKAGFQTTWKPEATIEAVEATPLPTDAKARKAIPIASGVLDYFPDAIIAIAECSRAGNDQHNPGKPLHWDRSKSCDESEALIRHYHGTGKGGFRRYPAFDQDGVAGTCHASEGNREG